MCSQFAEELYRYLSACILIVGGIVIVGFRCFYQSSFTQMEIREGTVMLALLFCNLIITMANAIYTATINGNERFVFDKCASIYVSNFDNRLSVI